MFELELAGAFLAGVASTLTGMTLALRWVLRHPERIAQLVLERQAAAARARLEQMAAEADASRRAG